ncbi:hypothetical protein Bpfe_027664, partial [Biomphalaria pfeifferi]
ICPFIISDLHSSFYFAPSMYNFKARLVMYFIMNSAPNYLRFTEIRTRGQGTREQGFGGQGTIGQGTREQGFGGQGTIGQGTREQGFGGQGTREQGFGGQGTIGQETTCDYQL